MCSACPGQCDHGTSILNNALYLGKLTWDSRGYVKNLAPPNAWFLSSSAGLPAVAQQLADWWLLRRGLYHSSAGSLRPRRPLAMHSSRCAGIATAKLPTCALHGRGKGYDRNTTIWEWRRPNCAQQFRSELQRIWRQFKIARSGMPTGRIGSSSGSGRFFRWRPEQFSAPPLMTTPTFFRRRGPAMSWSYSDRLFVEKSG